MSRACENLLIQTVFQLTLDDVAPPKESPEKKPKSESESGAGSGSIASKVAATYEWMHGLKLVVPISTYTTCTLCGNVTSLKLMTGAYDTTVSIEHVCLY